MPGNDSKHIDLAALPYRPCVGQTVINAAGLIWLGCRADCGNEPEGRGTWWQMPQGGIDPGEDPKTAARRELFEETGIRSIREVGETPDWLMYDLPDEMIGRAWGGRYRGQTQKWFAYRFIGNDAEINITPAGHEPEFSSWRWTPPSEVLDLIVPFKRAVYCQVLEAFAPLVRPENC